MAKLTQKAAKDLLEQGFVTQEQYDKMFAEGVVSASTRATRPQINVPNDKKDEFMDAAYEAMEKVANKLGFDFKNPTPDSGVATLYIKGSGKPRADKTEEAEAGELPE